MSKHPVLTGVSYTKGKTTVRLIAGDTLDSTAVPAADLKRFLARGTVGPKTKAKGGD